MMFFDVQVVCMFIEAHSILGCNDEPTHGVNHEAKSPIRSTYSPTRSPSSRPSTGTIASPKSSNPNNNPSPASASPLDKFSIPAKVCTSTTSSVCILVVVYMCSSSNVCVYQEQYYTMYCTYYCTYHFTPLYLPLYYILY